MDNKKRRLLTRVYEIIPGALTWLALTSPLWLSFNLPTVMAFVIIFLDVYWLYRVIKSMILSVVGYRKLKRALDADWIAKLETDFPVASKEIHHILIIPSWREHGYVIESTLAAIAKSDYPLQRVHVVLALEERDDPELKAEKRAVAEKYRNTFGGMYVTEHPANVEGEVIGPGSNRTYAMKSILPELRTKLDVSKTILTTLDADFAMHPKVISSLTHTYLSTPNPERRSYTGVIIYSNNYWQAPAPMRLIASTLMIGQLAELVESWKYVNFSSHSLNLQTLIDINFWSTDFVNDDSRLYWEAYYHFKGDYRVVPYWTPLYADAVLDETLGKTFINQYKQLQRWAYGVEHLPFILEKSFNASSVPILKRIERMFYALRAYLVVSTVIFLTGFAAFITLGINPTFRDTVLGQNLTAYSSYILTFALVGLVPMMILNSKLLPAMPREWSVRRKIWGYVQVILSPINLVAFGMLPAIDAQTRLMMGKYLTFRVTRKHRKVEEVENK